MSKEIKILGLTIDDKLTLNIHMVNVCRKALNVYKQLAKAVKSGVRDLAEDNQNYEYLHRSGEAYSYVSSKYLTIFNAGLFRK